MSTWTVQEIIDSYGNYARMQNGMDEARFLDTTQMRSDNWITQEEQTTGAMSACKDFEDLMTYISKAGIPEGYDTIVIFDGHHMGEGEDAEIGEVLVEATKIVEVIKIEDITDFDDYIDQLLGW